MSRPPNKRQRFDGPSVEEGASSHIFASPSSGPNPQSGSVLRPCSYEITLNYDTGLKRCLYAPPLSSQHKEAKSEWATSLVKWTSASGDQQVITDRYDAIHLLQDLPPKVPLTSAKEDDDVGWSDLDSDTEDLFYMTDAEAASFSHTKAKARLEAHHAARLASLRSPTPLSAPTTPQIDTKRPSIPGADTTAKIGLSKSQFELMQKTARGLSNSTNPSLLELKILANHGGDDRFAFLHSSIRSKKGDEITDPVRVWEELKKAKGEMSYEDVLRLLQPSRQTILQGNSGTRLGLVAYDDSDSEDESEQQAGATAATPLPANKADAVEENADKDAEKKRKQAERLARAKAWLKTRSKQAP
ncbi:hypothetical protein NDA11_000643 [Ustilago hordei]|uniref:SURP motif domain-containing protein n=1 Tax=Ustilago hordei TaxID=120017 RepID=I2FXF6_USTHO|nr:uncharacterized protein UHO2_00031 [Ustilago hordei]KAJ1043644.1 hypothetical protein NDA10_000667 [Ustilago hordei]KAJ1570525.1 hypothetical protein NDA11_000643 [Ustilago hordei]KAJ1587384.1 hypothetical protein NDA15_005099 [Ustilago hordei]KAJ1590272.1 hypothetical protein NDA12_005737 [Ustilago hordei]KAJ1602160.1 hypothetical protein NDA14_002266 [Ustilago hordei]